MIFGTAERLSKCGKKLILYYDGESKYKLQKHVSIQERCWTVVFHFQTISWNVQKDHVEVTYAVFSLP